MNCNEIRGAMFWLGWVAVMTVLAIPASVEAQSLQYCGLVGGPQRPGVVDSTGGWWRVGSGGSIRWFEGERYIGWSVYEASNPSDAVYDMTSLDIDVTKVMNGQQQNGSDAPGSCGGDCMRWPEGIVGYDESNPQIIYGYYVEERPVCTPSAGFQFVHALIGQMKSVDGGLTWFDQGIVLDAPGDDQCVTSGNYQMVGGVGDPGVIRFAGYVYIVATNYAGGDDSDDDYAKANQGFLIARMDWNDRDNPVGAFKWFNSNSALYDIQAVDASGSPSIVPTITFVHNVRPVAIFGNARSWRTGNGVRPYGNYTEGSLHYNSALGKFIFVASKLYSGDNPWLLSGHYAAYLDTAAIVTNPVDGWQAFYDASDAIQSHSISSPTPLLVYSPGYHPVEQQAGYPQFVGMGSNDDDKSSTGTSVFFFTGNDGNEALLSAADETLTCTATAVADIGPVPPLDLRFALP